MEKIQIAARQKYKYMLLGALIFAALFFAGIELSKYLYYKPGYGFGIPKC